MSVLQIRIPDKLVPVFTGEAMYRGAYGGRGSAKTRTFAKMAAVKGIVFAEANMPGVIVCGREFMNSLDESSLAEVKAAIAEEPWLSAKYEVGEKFVRTKDGRISFAFIGLRHNLDSIKSKSRIRLLWVDEAEPVSETAWMKAIPTVREEGAEIWITWNPERKKSATHKRFRLDPPEGSKIIQLNWRDNPWFPSTLNKTRLEDKAKRPDQYEHVWEGDFVTAVEGAYYAPYLTRAKEQGRISRVAFDPLMRVRVYVDIGGTGAKADAFAMWPSQFIGREIRTRDYYEAQGQPLATHIQWLHSKGYKPSVADIYLPHDGATNEKIIDASFESAFRAAGYSVTVIPNQGKGAAKQRVEAGRRVFDSIWFDEETTQDGRDALGWYHEKRSDDEREALLGPEHDWCLAAGTKILTSNGWQPVETIRVGDFVETPRGLREVIRSGIVRNTSEWISVRGILCTPEHRFFTSRGLKEARELSSKDRLWTRRDLAPRILAFLCAISHSGLKGHIISATREGRTGTREGILYCCTVSSTKLFMAASRMVTRFTTGMAILSTAIRQTLMQCQGESIASCTNLNIGSSALVECVGERSVVISRSDRDAATNADEPIMRVWSESAAPAYNLTVEIDECYFVRGDDGVAYLSSNSSHGADAFGLMCVSYEDPARTASFNRAINYPRASVA